MKAAAIILGILLVSAIALFLFEGTVEPHGTPSRTMTEIQQLSAAAEAYKTEEGHYPSDPASSDQLDPNTTYDPAAYLAASAFLYHALAGGTKNYLNEAGFPLQHLKLSETGVSYFVDQWGNSLGYSTFKAAHPGSPDGYNPTFDLWSTGGGTKKADTDRWFKTW